MIVGAFDVHRAQITYDWVDRATGEARRGQITPATREGLRSWLGELPAGGGHVAVEGCTGWRFVVEELQAAGLAAHLAEPAETSSLRGPKRRAKTDRTDARLLRELLEQYRLPCSWTPPAWILDLRTTVRPWSTSAPPSSSASTPPCSTTGCPVPPRNCYRGPPAAGWRPTPTSGPSIGKWYGLWPGSAALPAWRSKPTDPAMSWRPWGRYRSRPGAGGPGATPPPRSNSTDAITTSPTLSERSARSLTTRSSGSPASGSARPSTASRPSNRPPTVPATASRPVSAPISRVLASSVAGKARSGPSASTQQKDDMCRDLLRLKHR